jgi:hypothetical protein
MTDFVNSIEKEMLISINSGLLNPKNLVFFNSKIGEAKQLITALQNGSSKWTAEMVKNMYVEGVRFGATTLGIETLFSKFDVQAMNVLAQNIYGRFQDLTTVVGRRVNDVYREVALANIKGNIAGYQGLYDTADRIKQGLAERGITGFTDVAGREWNMTSYTDMVARTSTMETFRQGTANEYIQNDIDLVQINNVITSMSCEVCRKYAGKIISLTGKTPGYPTLDEIRAEGMFHPNCIHSYHVVIPDLGALQEENKRLEAQYYGK